MSSWIDRSASSGKRAKYAHLTIDTHFSKRPKGYFNPHDVHKTDYASMDVHKPTQSPELDRQCSFTCPRSSLSSIELLNSSIEDFSIHLSSELPTNQEDEVNYWSPNFYMDDCNGQAKNDPLCQSFSSLSSLSISPSESLESLSLSSTFSNEELDNIPSTSIKLAQGSATVRLPSMEMKDNESSEWSNEGSVASRIRNLTRYSLPVRKPYLDLDAFDNTSLSSLSSLSSMDDYVPSPKYGWNIKFIEMKGLFEAFVPAKSSVILLVGWNTSSICTELSQQGWSAVFCAEDKWSRQDQHYNCSGSLWRYDAVHNTIHFDSIFSKGSDEMEVVETALRRLKPGGVWICILSKAESENQNIVSVTSTRWMKRQMIFLDSYHLGVPEKGSKSLEAPFVAQVYRRKESLQERIQRLEQEKAASDARIITTIQSLSDEPLASKTPSKIVQFDPISYDRNGVLESRDQETKASLSDKIIIARKWISGNEITDKDDKCREHVEEANVKKTTVAEAILPRKEKTMDAYQQPTENTIISKENETKAAKATVISNITSPLLVHSKGTPTENVDDDFEKWNEDGDTLVPPMLAPDSTPDEDGAVHSAISYILSQVQEIAEAPKVTSHKTEDQVDRMPIGSEIIRHENLNRSPKESPKKSLNISEHSIDDRTIKPVSSCEETVEETDNLHQSRPLVPDGNMFMKAEQILHTDDTSKEEVSTVQVQENVRDIDDVRMCLSEMITHIGASGSASIIIDDDTFGSEAHSIVHQQPIETADKVSYKKQANAVCDIPSSQSTFDNTIALSPEIETCLGSVVDQVISTFDIPEN